MNALINEIANERKNKWNNRQTTIRKICLAMNFLIALVKKKLGLLRREKLNKQAGNILKRASSETGILTRSSCGYWVRLWTVK